MARRSKRMRDAAPPAVSAPSVVRAIFDPAGDIRVRVVTPSGNAYEVLPRVSFLIATEDVDWFFYAWDWEHRQRLCRAEEYQPRRPQFNNGRQIEDRPDRPQFDNGEAEAKAHVEEPERPVLEPETSPPEPEDPLRELLVTEPEETAPDPVVEAAEGETDEDKE